MVGKKYTYDELVEIIAVLRGPEGCAWDRKQTHDTLKESILEESYELVEAINNKDIPNMKEELGDVLLQVLMHAEIGKSEGTFDLEEVIDGIANKLVYRHPHVFKEQHATPKSDKEVLVQWEELKKKEKQYTSDTQVLEGVAKALPALTRSYKVVKKARKVYPENSTKEMIIEQAHEKLEKVEKHLKIQDLVGVGEEIGELMLLIVKLSSFLEINPEFALTKALEKFINRFRYIENSAFAMNKQLSTLTLEEVLTLETEYKNVGLKH